MTTRPWYWGAIVIGVFGLVVLVVVDVAPYGVLKASTDFRSYDPNISRLFPTGRVEENKEGYLVLSEPVYFTMRLPRRMDRAVVRLRYRNSSSQHIGLGLEQQGSSDDAWRYAIQTLPQVDREWQEVAITFDLSNAQVVDRRIRFIVSVPEYQPEAPVVLGGVDVVLEGQPLTVPLVMSSLYRLIARAV